MRFLATLLVFMLVSCPAWAAFKGPSSSAAPVTTATAAASADEGATAVLEGTITEHLQKDRYTFKDASGSIPINIPAHVFGSLEVTPKDTVRVTGEVRGKKDPNRKDDTHLGVGTSKSSSSLSHAIPMALTDCLKGK